ncbi:hypothetical protein TNIN_214611 [Trichonephila inaurata madagascariensis]|uniref:Uncharacterized protein n=1 Tax=Trichonephila inaurata madagascariensis TaxID=2747483 RepID=A0A8X6WWY7_9ARAC|nr:hypothetical protein TNIN_214611 [Trichonephila inaurata madagascariensis]
MREYRARKKIYLQSTNDSRSVVHHQDDEILQADDNLNKSHEFVGLPCQDIKRTISGRILTHHWPCQDIKATRKKTSAERLRDYRTWKKARIQSTSDSSSVVHQEDEILLADDNLNSSHEFVGIKYYD